MYAHMYTHVPKLGGGLPCRQTGQIYVSGWTGRLRLGQAGAATPHCDQQDYMFDWTMRITRHVHTYMYMCSWHTCTGIHVMHTCTYNVHLHAHVRHVHGTCVCTWHTCTYTGMYNGTCTVYMYMYLSGVPVCRCSDTQGIYASLGQRSESPCCLPYGPAPAATSASQPQ